MNGGVDKVVPGRGESGQAVDSEGVHQVGQAFKVCCPAEATAEYVFVSSVLGDVSKGRTSSIVVLEDQATEASSCEAGPVTSAVRGLSGEMSPDVEYCSRYPWRCPPYQRVDGLENLKCSQSYPGRD